MKHDVGLIGLAVMGQNLALNCRDNGFNIAVFNRSYAKTQQFIANHLSSPTPQQSSTQPSNTTAQLNGFEQLNNFVESLSTPRKIILMVQAGEATDQVIQQLLALLEPNDIIIDGGNADFLDTQRRLVHCKTSDIRYIGTGISGGEEGARFGPSIMPGGDASAWPDVQTILQSIAAKVNDQACCKWIGAGGSGHFVKMVHNGIEYGDMQLISESYDVLKRIVGLNNDELAATFSAWNKGKLESYLIEITADIFTYKDEQGDYVIDQILDTAGQKGTGRWTAINAMNLGTPLTIIAEAVYTRSLSARKQERVAINHVLSNKLAVPETLHKNKEKLIETIGQALYAAKILSYAQGFMLLSDASEHYDWQLNLANIASIWRGGCIIRSQFLNDINIAYTEKPNLKNLLLSDYFKQEITQAEDALRETVILAISHGIATPTLSAALSFLDGIKQANSPANLLQAQRDYFGAHTYERIDKAKGEFFHTDWTGLNGQATSGSYDA